MKKVLLVMCLFVSTAVIAQNEKEEGDAMAASENYSGAAMMYRICMEKDEQCRMKLFMLIYEKKIEMQSSDELYQLINQPARSGNSEAQFYLGKMFQSGTGISKNESEALNWLLKSAGKGKGNANAQFELGNMYRYGQGVKTNISTAQKWYTKSAAQGHFDAQNSLTDLAQSKKEPKEKKEKASKEKKEKATKEKKEKAPKEKKEKVTKEKKEKTTKEKKEKAPKEKKEKAPKERSTLLKKR